MEKIIKYKNKSQYKNQKDKIKNLQSKRIKKREE